MGGVISSSSSFLQQLVKIKSTRSRVGVFILREELEKDSEAMAHCPFLLLLYDYFFCDFYIVLAELAEIDTASIAFSINH